MTSTAQLDRIQDERQELEDEYDDNEDVEIVPVLYERVENDGTAYEWFEPMVLGVVELLAQGRISNYLEKTEYEHEDAPLAVAYDEETEEVLCVLAEGEA